jgi:hypothetical protein
MTHAAMIKVEGIGKAVQALSLTGRPALGKLSAYKKYQRTFSRQEPFPLKCANVRDARHHWAEGCGEILAAL